MKNLLILIIPLTLWALFILGFASNKPDSRSNANFSTQERTPALVADSSGTRAPQRKTTGAVEVQVTPLRLEANAQPVLKIELDTHAVELDYDLIKIVELTDEMGSSYKPLEWSGSSGGHHLAGELSFENLKAEAQTVTLTFWGIEGQTAEFEFKIGGENNET